MRLSLPLRALGVAGCLVLLPSVSEGAIARQQGLSGYSGTLSSVSSILQQQLICDPEAPLRGATSTSYDPSLVTLVGLQAGPGYAVGGAVELIDIGSETIFFQNLFGPGGYFDTPAPNAVETGLARVIYEQIGEPGQINPVGQLLAENKGVTGIDGIDTHAFLFEAVPGVGLPLLNLAQYEIFAGPNDYMDLLDDNGEVVRLGPGDISPVVVGVPEPAGLGLLGAAGLVLGARIRRRRVPA